MNIIVLQIWENRQVNAFRMLITIWDDLTHWVHMIFTRTPSPPQWPLQGRQGENSTNCWWRADQTLRHLNVSYFCWRSVAWAVFKMFYIPVYCLVHRDHEIFLKFTMDDDIRTHKLMGIFYISGSTLKNLKHVATKPTKRPGNHWRSPHYWPKLRRNNA